MDWRPLYTPTLWRTSSRSCIARLLWFGLHSARLRQLKLFQFTEACGSPSKITHDGKLLRSFQRISRILVKAPLDDGLEGLKQAAAAGHCSIPALNRYQRTSHLKVE